MLGLLCFDNQSPAAFADELRSHANQHGLTCITATRSAARALGTGHRPLHRLASEIIATEGLRVASSLEAWSTLREALRQVTAVSDELGYLRTWSPSIYELLRAAPRLEPRDAVPEDAPALSSRTRQLIQVTRCYQQRLREQGWVDSHELLWRAAEIASTNEIERRSLLIYGYFHPRADELAWVEAIAQDPSLLCLTSSQSAALIPPLQQRGWGMVSLGDGHHSCANRNFVEQNTNLPRNSEITQSAAKTYHPQIAAYAYPTPDAEMRGTLAQVKQLLEQGVLARDIVLIARNEAELGPHLLDLGWEYDIPLRALYSIPLSTTRFGTWITLMLDAIQQRFSYDATVRFLSHPLSGGVAADVWPQIRQQRPHGFEAWQALAQEHLTLDLSPLRLPPQAKRETWVEKLRGLFRHFDTRRRAARWARESVAYNTLEDNLVHLAQPEDEILGNHAWLEDLQMSLTLLTTPAQPGRGGVELHTPASVKGGRYRYAFVLNAIEGTLPKTVSNDPVLDFYERRRLEAYGLSLPRAADLARQEKFEFEQCVHTVCDRLTLSFTPLAGEPSPYFETLDVTPQPPPDRAIASLPEARQIYLRQAVRLEDAVLQRAIAAFEVEKSRESADPPNEYDGVVGLPFDTTDHWFSVSQLTQLGQCPFKWFAGYGLQLREHSEPDTDLSPSLRGRLYHKVLELALQALPTSSEDWVVPDDAQLDAWFREAEAALHWPPIPAWESRRIEHIHQLRRAMQSPDFRAPGSEVVWLESKFAGEWQGLKVWGYVDRIDRTDEGLILIDYKTSKTPPKGIKDADGNAKIDLQLPLYEAIAAPHLAPDEPVHHTAYFSINAAKDITPKTQVTDLEAVADSLKTHLTQGHYPVQPDVDGHACTYCAYDAVCRRGDRLHRKFQIPAQESDA